MSILRRPETRESNTRYQSEETDWDNATNDSRADVATAALVYLVERSRVSRAVMEEALWVGEQVASEPDVLAKKVRVHHLPICWIEQGVERAVTELGGLLFDPARRVSSIHRIVDRVRTNRRRGGIWLE